MSNPRMTYFEKEDVLHLVLSEGAEAKSVELSPDITVELRIGTGSDLSNSFLINYLAQKTPSI